MNVAIEVAVVDRETPVKGIEVWKHGELTSGKQDSKYELEALLFPSVSSPIESRL